MERYMAALLEGNGRCRQLKPRRGNEVPRRMLPRAYSVCTLIDANNRALSAFLSRSHQEPFLGLQDEARKFVIRVGKVDTDNPATGFGPLRAFNCPRVP